MSRFKQSLHPLKQRIADLEFILGKAEIRSWQAVQEIVRAGLASKAFKIGDQLVSLYDGEPIIWDVIGFDHDTPTDKDYTHSLTIQTHDCIARAQFDAPEPDNPEDAIKSSGNNRYLHSAIRQWLNSPDVTFQWEAQHQYDVAPTDAPYTGAGFLHLLDPELAAVIGKVDKQAARNTVTDGGGQDTFSDMVFLLSKVELYAVAEGVTDGEKAYPYYSALAAQPTDGALTGRIKYMDGTARQWWLRSPTVVTSANGRRITALGDVGIGSNNASKMANYISPVVCIV